MPKSKLREIVDEIDKQIIPLLDGKEEEHSFHVTRGISFPDVTIYLKNRMKAFPLSGIEKTYDQCEDFSKWCGLQYRNLKSSQWVPDRPIAYSRKEMLNEIWHALITPILVGYTQSGLRNIVNECEEATNEEFNLPKKFRGERSIGQLAFKMRWIQTKLAHIIDERNDLQKKYFDECKKRKKLERGMDKNVKRT